MVGAPSALLAAALAAVSAAQSTIVTVMMPPVDWPLVASVVEVFPSATSYLIACPTGTSREECDLPGVMSLLSGPATMSYKVGGRESSTLDGTCKIDPEIIDCTGTISVSGYVSVTSVSWPASRAPELHQTLTVTAGAEKLQEAAPTTAGAPRITQNAIVTGAMSLVGDAMRILGLRGLA